MELINNILNKLNNWCFNFWVGFGNRAGWIRSAHNSSSNRWPFHIANGIIFCILPLKQQIKPKLNPKDAAVLLKKQSQKRDNYISAVNSRSTEKESSKKDFKKGPKEGSKRGPKDFKKGSERGPKS